MTDAKEARDATDYAATKFLETLTSCSLSLSLPLSRSLSQSLAASYECLSVSKEKVCGDFLQSDVHSQRGRSENGFRRHFIFL